MNITSTDFLNLAVGTFFGILVIFVCYMLVRLVKVLDELREVLTEAKETGKNARAISESGRRVVGNVEDTVETIGAVAGGLIRGFGSSKKNKRRR